MADENKAVEEKMDEAKSATYAAEKKNQQRAFLYITTAFIFSAFAMIMAGLAFGFIPGAPLFVAFHLATKVALITLTGLVGALFAALGLSLFPGHSRANISREKKLLLLLGFIISLSALAIAGLAFIPGAGPLVVAALGYKIMLIASVGVLGVGLVAATFLKQDNLCKAYAALALLFVVGLIAIAILIAPGISTLLDSSNFLHDALSAVFGAVSCSLIVASYASYQLREEAREEKNRRNCLVVKESEGVAVAGMPSQHVICSSLKRSNSNLRLEASALDHPKEKEEGEEDWRLSSDEEDGYDLSGDENDYGEAYAPVPYSHKTTFK